MTDRLPSRSQDQLPVLQDGGLPQTRGSAQSPVHRAQSLKFADATETREELWARLPTTVRQRVEGRYGQLLEWWAESDEHGRVSAVVLGDQALVTVEPTVNTSGGPAHRVARMSLVPSSFRSVLVNGPSQAVPGGPDQSLAPSAGPGSGTPSSAERIPRVLAGFLGHLPVRAQTLLQEPFLVGGAELDWRRYYLRHGHGGGMSATNLRVWCYLTDMRTLTFATGTGYGYRDGVGADSWQLTCWRANRQ
jgi:hypothetical protein